MLLLVSLLEFLPLGNVSKEDILIGHAEVLEKEPRHLSSASQLPVSKLKHRQGLKVFRLHDNN